MSAEGETWGVPVWDLDGLIEMFRKVAGREFVGPVDGVGCIELVFGDPDQSGGNMITLFTRDGHYFGNFFLGSTDPDYARRWNKPKKR